ncbi:MAG: RNA polymerase sigma factor [Micavibrio sp.]
MVEQNTDRGLIQKASIGDVKAFEALVEQHYDFVYRVAYRWSGNKADSEDIAHNVFLKMADCLESFRFQSSFKTWLCRMVINAAKDYKRRMFTTHHRTIALDEKIPAHADTESQTYAGEIFRFIQKLPEEQKEVLILVFCEEMTHREVADILNCPEGTVSWRIHEARKNLQDMMGKGNGHG